MMLNICYYFHRNDEFVGSATIGALATRRPMSGRQLKERSRKKLKILKKRWKQEENQPRKPTDTNAIEKHYVLSPESANGPCVLQRLSEAEAEGKYAYRRAGTLLFGSAFLDKKFLVRSIM